MLTEPVALAPEPGAEQRIGDVSGPAEAFGIKPGMGLAEALGRCPSLRLVAPDPARAESVWEEAMRRLEAAGAEIEPGAAGEAFCELDGLEHLLGGSVQGVLSALGAAVAMPCRLGGGPNRFSAFVAAGVARSRRPPPVVSAKAVRRFLAPRSIELLRPRLGSAGERRSREAARLVETFARLGIATLGELAELPRVAVSDRFGPLGLEAQRLARGVDAPLRPRRAHEELLASIELPDAAYGPQLDRAVELLVERLLADPNRRGRSIRALRLEARLAGGGSWRARITTRSATASAERLRLAVGPRLGELPAPASRLRLRAVELGESAPPQPALTANEGERRRELLGEAVRQAQAAAGGDAVMRVVDVDAASRVPERRTMLTPHVPGPG